MNQSLDEFIQNKFSNRRRDRGRSRSRGPRRNSISDRNTKASVLGRQRLAYRMPIPDARFLIIQKKREKLTDARDQLAQLARHSDLRSKLDRMHGGPRKELMRLPGFMGITKQTALNGEISLKTNRQSRLSHFPYPKDDLVHPSVKHTLNDIGLPSYQVSARPQSPYGWNSRTSGRRRGDDLITQEASMTSARLLSEREGWGQRNQPKRRPDVAVIPSVEIEDSDDEDMDLNGVAAASRITSDLKARLDSSSGYSGRPTMLSTTTKQLSHTTAKVGHRIVVSNLHPTVIHEDIRELFEDVGTLIDSRLVRPGTAEVVYQNLEDAVKAVDLYHNRHLDGQPMKCLLVNSSLPKSSSSMRADSTPQFKLPTGTKSSIVPDVVTIHKALFNKS